MSKGSGSTKGQNGKRSDNHQDNSFMLYKHANNKWKNTPKRTHHPRGIYNQHPIRCKDADTAVTVIHQERAQHMRRPVEDADHFKVVCKSAETRQKAVHDVKQNTTGDKQVDTLNITSFNFNTMQSVKITKLKNEQQSKWCSKVILSRCRQWWQH